MLPNMFLAYIRLIFRGSFVEITTAILLVCKILYSNNIAVVISTKDPLKMSLIQARNMLGSI
jgi:hypothetical protein